VKVETQARLEGRNMSMVLSPDKKALDAAKAAQAESAAEESSVAVLDQGPAPSRRRERVSRDGDAAVSTEASGQPAP
jgi:translation initiation factor IF-3